jgi:hypothetical protein
MPRLERPTGEPLTQRSGRKDTSLRITARPFSFRILSRNARDDLGDDRVDIVSSIAVYAVDDHAR